jgi:hypothetical protein
MQTTLDNTSRVEMSISNSYSSIENKSEASHTPLLNLEFQKHAVEFTFPLPKEVEEAIRNTGGFGVIF